MLVENINCYVCDWAEGMPSLMLLTAYSAAGLRVYMLRDNIEMDITEMALIFTLIENNIISIYSQYRQIHSRYLVD